MKKNVFRILSLFYAMAFTICLSAQIPFWQIQYAMDSLSMPVAKQKIGNKYAMQFMDGPTFTTTILDFIEFKNDSLCVVDDTCVALVPGITSFSFGYDTTNLKFVYTFTNDGEGINGEIPFAVPNDRFDLMDLPTVYVYDQTHKPWEAPNEILNGFRLDNILQRDSISPFKDLLKIGHYTDLFGLSSAIHDSIEIDYSRGNLWQIDGSGDLTNIYETTKIGEHLRIGEIFQVDYLNDAIAFFNGSGVASPLKFGPGFTLSNDTLNYTESGSFSGLYTDLDFTGTTGLSDGVDDVDDADNDSTNEGQLSFVNAGGGVYRIESSTPGGATPFFNDGNLPFGWTWNITGNAIGLNATIDYSDINNTPAPLWSESAGNIYRQSNVGVGITNPTSLFHVYGSGQHLFQVSESGDGSISTRIGNFYMRAPDNNNVFARLSVANTDEGFFQFYDGGVTGIYMRAGGLSYFNNNLAIGTTSGSARLTVKGITSLGSTDAVNVENSSGTSLFHVENGGNVGIGTNTPSSILDVVGSTELNGTLTVGDLDDGGGINILLADVNGKIVEGQLGNGLSMNGGVLSSLWTSSTQGRMYRFSGESLPYVGIQTTNPTHELHVNGDIRIESGTIIDTDNSGGSTGQFLGRDAGGIHWENIPSNTDNQTLSWNASSDQITISGGNTIDISDITPDQYNGRGYNTGSQTVSGTSVIAISNISYAENVTVSTTTERFTAQEAGFYTASCQCEISAVSTSGDATISLRLNGSVPISGQYSLTHYVDHTDGKIINYIDEIEMAVNDYIDFTLSNDSGSNKVLENCKISLRRN